MSRLHLPRLLLLATLIPAAFAATPAWVTRSNQLAEPVLAAIARFDPEGASGSGQEQFDTNVVDMGPKLFERQQKVTEGLLADLRKERQVETDRHVQQDLDIMIDTLQRKLQSEKLNHDQMLASVDVSQIVFGGLRSLLDARNKPERQARALIRLKRYAGLETGYMPLAEQARVYQQAELQRPGLIGPYVDEVQQQLDNTDYYLKGLAELFKKANLTGWEQPLATLGQQLHSYDDWVRKEVLPRTRKEARQPVAIYADTLRQMGVDIGPDELIERATADYQEVRDQMQTIAARIAQQRKLPSSDYRDVIRELKKSQIEPTALLPLYWQRLREIEAIVRREQLLTLPDRQANIRLASEAESAQIPAPHMQPPRLIGNTGEYGEFVLPLTNPHAKSKAVMDDFSHDAITWALAAHEARPGHELQFASMVERGTSLPRVLFAMNSANVEGWALYCEALVFPYIPEDGQLFTLQTRMMRMARAFLDPMVNTGRISPDEAKRFLMDEVLLSEPMAQQEADRYAFNSPGQATSYYYGYLNMRSLRTQTEIALGAQFNLKSFNDFILGQGLLPPRQMREAVMQDFIPTQRTTAKQASR
ncbi:DUF885 domain-containing protein [Chitinimonas sp.]|uniref:DUF885 domain-containing protein n=1 Tax=Chitinimonas sp. TaxID=1934313 RepID=UPI002F94CB72